MLVSFAQTIRISLHLACRCRRPLPVQFLALHRADLLRVVCPRLLFGEFSSCVLFCLSFVGSVVASCCALRAASRRRRTKPPERQTDEGTSWGSAGGASGNTRRTSTRATSQTSSSGRISESSSCGDRGQSRAAGPARRSTAGSERGHQPSAHVTKATRALSVLCTKVLQVPDLPSPRQRLTVRFLSGREREKRLPAALRLHQGAAAASTGIA
jgi:hypothetical protein